MGSNPAMANSLGTVKFALIDLIRIFGFFYVLRFTIQFFGHINPYDGGLFETIYTFTEPYTRLFLGFLPSLYNMDMGLILGFIILDRIETLISKIAILDFAGAFVLTAIFGALAFVSNQDRVARD